MKKNWKSIVFSLAAVAVLGFSSCAGGYTCPTYMQNEDANDTEISVSNVELSPEEIN